MKKEVRTISYDDDLKIEAYSFEGIIRPFPNHFHDDYVIGFVQNGMRTLSCKNKEYTIKSGDILLFNPKDNHSCMQMDEGAFDYISINIPTNIMASLTEEITGKRDLICFSKNVLTDTNLSNSLIILYKAITLRAERFEKEEALYLFISSLTEKYGQPFEDISSEYSNEIENICRYMQKHYAEHISLEELCRHCSLSKSTLLRAFTKQKGITPYRYLQSIRIDKAKKLLETGTSLSQTALLTGFTDQSHFTNYFHMYIGISPASYKKIFIQEREDEQQKKQH